MIYRTAPSPTSAPSKPTSASVSEHSKNSLLTRDSRMPEPKPPPIKWTLARAATIRRSIAVTERELLRDLTPREREDVQLRLDTMRRLVRASR